jgi:transcriptional regulator with XRE-family HTH domain
MFSIADLLDRARSRANIPSDYKLADVLGITRSAVSSWRMGKSYPDERALGQLCALSGDDPGIWAANVQAERAQSPEGKNMWLLVAKRLAGGASTAILSVLIALGLVALPAEPAQAADGKVLSKANCTFLYIVSSTFLSVGQFVMVRLRWFTPFFWCFAHA